MAGSCRAARGCDGSTSMSGNYDVIIIGSGAGGGTLARQLAPTGKRILILERGDWLKREAVNWDAKAVFVDNRYVSQDTWYDSNGKPFQPQGPLFCWRRNQNVRRRPVSLAPGGFRRTPRIRWDLAGLANQLRRHGALLHEGRANVSGAWPPRSGPDRTARKRTIALSAGFP